MSPVRRLALLWGIAIGMAFALLASGAGVGGAAVSDPGGGGGFNVPPSSYCTEARWNQILNWGGWDFRCYWFPYLGSGSFCYATCTLGYFPTHYGWHQH